MNIYIWRHSKQFSSWSMMDEPHICRDNYIRANVMVLAESKHQALELLGNDSYWNVDELQRIEPEVIRASEAAIVGKFIC
ncbi:MAG: hypothetical protein PHP23_10135 [Desulfobacterales bacterium]|nr:hypothetical protein [Desulfobacterales bacterium]MDD4072666.1 hypothetical protein [Desulfobacterales bacterium]MDD4391775.1 hypothetical protein [Desulfobacterales bacterium]